MVSARARTPTRASTARPVPPAIRERGAGHVWVAGDRRRGGGGARDGYRDHAAPGAGAGDAAADSFHRAAPLQHDLVR
eukprot:275892-Prymnesium_polylepis.1